VAKIDPALFEAIKTKSGLQQAAIYARIGKVARERYLDRDVAALAVAAEFDVAINRYAKDGQLVPRHRGFDRLKGR
jgi:hypothetical protein